MTSSGSPAEATTSPSRTATACTGWRDSTTPPLRATTLIGSATAGPYVPELPEIEALRRLLDGPVSALPVARAGPAHIATLKTFDPPIGTLEGRRLAGAERRGKNLLFPTEDDELVLRIHLMSAGRVRYLLPGEKGPKSPAFQLAFQGGGRLVLTEAGKKKRAGVWLLEPEAVDAELAHLGPDALGPRPGAPRRDPARGVAAAAPAAPRPARARGHRARVVERDPAHGAPVAVRALVAARRRGGRAARRGDRRGARARPGAARARRLRREDLPRPRPPRRALSRLRHTPRPRGLRGAHDLLLPPVPDRRPGSEGPAALAVAALTRPGARARRRGARAALRRRPDARARRSERYAREWRCVARPDARARRSGAARVGTAAASPRWRFGGNCCSPRTPLLRRARTARPAAARRHRARRGSLTHGLCARPLGALR